jgi:hypothetical protein
MSPEGDSPDANDDKIARWGRARVEGFHKFQHNFVQPAPMLFTQDHHPLWLGDIYRGRSAFLIAGGPSFATLDHSLLRQPGILTMGLNNSVKTFRPNLWVSVDPPDRFLRSVWLDPTILKFVPICHAKKFIFNSDSWEFMDMRVGDCPNVVYYKRNEHFKARQFLWEDCVNWGNHKKHGSGRSVMLAALRILFILGIRRVYLLGVDFNMSETNRYHFAQDRSAGAIKGNNFTFRVLNERLEKLRPYFEKEDFLVLNCNPCSNLKAFDFIPYEEAVRKVLAEFDFVNVAAERTQGLYDTKTEEKKQGQGR